MATDAWLMRIDGSGMPVWAKSFIGTENDELTGVVAMPTGDRRDRDAGDIGHVVGGPLGLRCWHHGAFDSRGGRAVTHDVVVTGFPRSGRSRRRRECLDDGAVPVSAGLGWTLRTGAVAARHQFWR